VTVNSPEFFLLLSALVFAIGLIGLIIRRNPLVMFMSIELMLNASNLAFMTFSRFTKNTPGLQGGPADGPVFTFVVMTIAAAEAVVGLAIIITIFRNRRTVDVDALADLKG
jgi:NADH-quinone oxidoreductase subunit K